MTQFGLSNKNPTKYLGRKMGVAPLMPYPRIPLSTDKHFPVGQLAIIDRNPQTGLEGDIYYLSRFDSSGLAVWLQLETGTVVADYPITPYVVGPVGQAGYQTVQSAIDAVAADGNDGAIWIQTGTYTEDLVFPDGMNVGLMTSSDEDAGAAHIIGVHTPPPLTGNIVIWRVKMTSSTHIFSSASAGAGEITLVHNNYNVNGYIFDLVNWTGNFVILNIGDRGSTASGVINNTGGAGAFLFGSALGVGNTFPMITSGLLVMQDVVCGCPVNTGAGTILDVYRSFFSFTLTAGNDTSGKVFFVRFDTTTNASFIMSSSGNIDFVSNIVNSSNSPAIDGAGAGTLTLEGISFLDNAEVAGTLTVVRKTTLVGTLDANNLTFDEGVSTLDANGELWIGSGAGNPAPANITSTDASLTVTNGPNTIDLSAAGGVTLNGWNGSIIEQATVTVTSDGATITCSIEASGGGDIQVIFSDGIYDWDTTPPDTISLTAGSDTAPVINYVYFLQSTKALTASTVSFPAAEHAPVAEVICQSAASLQTQAPYMFQVWLDHVTDENDEGHIHQLNNWIRNQHATWKSGVLQTYTITPNGGAPDNVLIETTLGSILELKEHEFPAFSSPLEYYNINSFATPYDVVTDLNALLTDSTGASMSGRRFSLVLWGASSEEGDAPKLFVNVPRGSYTNNTDLLEDVSKFAVFDIPSDYTNTGFLISEFKLRHQAASSGTWTSIDEIDLRGLLPSVAPGGTTSFPVEFDDGLFRIFSTGDDTKHIAFDASPITTATTRTITAVDADLALAEVITDITTDSGTAVGAANGASIVGAGGVTTSAAGAIVTITGTGNVSQIVSSETPSVVTCSTVIPNDDTIPQQSTEGDLVLSVAITPESASSTLIIEFTSFGTPSALNATSVALFVDSTENAIAAIRDNSGSTNGSDLSIRKVVSSASLTARTYKVHVGPSTGSFHINGGSAGTRLFGGVASTLLTVTEII